MEIDTTASVDSILLSTLLPLGVPVTRLRFTGKAETYITFQIISGDETGFADDDGTAYEHLYRVDLFSKRNYVQILDQMKRALKTAGFFGISVNAEQYERDTELYHASLNINYMED